MGLNFSTQLDLGRNAFYIFVSITPAVPNQIRMHDIVVATQGKPSSHGNNNAMLTIVVELDGHSSSLFFGRIFPFNQPWS